MNIEAATLQFTYPDIGIAISWYTQFFGRKADFISSEEFQEWEVFPNFWLQIANGEVNKNPTRLRFGVQDIEEQRQKLEQDMKLTVTDRFYTEDVVLLYNFYDPWGYKLGIFQDLQRYPI